MMPTAALEAAAKAGQCGLLSVELDRRAGDETPRVTIKRFQPLSDLAKRTRLQMTVRVRDGAMAERIARELADARGGNGLVALHRADGVGRRGDRRRRPRLRARRANSPQRSSGSPARAASTCPSRSRRSSPCRLGLKPSRSRRGSRGS